MFYLIITSALTDERRRVWLIASALVIAVELLTANLDSRAVYDPIPPHEQIAMSPPLFIAPTIPSADDPFGVDGDRGLTDNFGSLYGVRDIHGISPLWLAGMDMLVRGDLPDQVTWALLGVRYVFTDWQELPIPSRIVDQGEDRYGAVNLHELDNPLPFASVVYRAAQVADDQAAYDRLRDLNFDHRQIVLVDQPVNVAGEGDYTAAEVVSFAPERIVLRVNIAADGVLRVALPHYVGWNALVDGAPVEIIRTYGALTGVPVSAGEHTIELVYDPLSYRAGAVLSLVTLAALVMIGLMLFARGRRYAVNSTHR